MALTYVGHSRTTCSATTPQVSRNIPNTANYGYTATGPESNLNPGALLFKQDLASGTYQTFDLATITGNPFNLPMGPDNHYTFGVISDVDENIWVIGNTHANPWQFGYTRWPPTPTSWTFPSFASLPFSSLGINMHTYSQFARATDGTIYVLMEQEENLSYEKRFWSLAKLVPHSLTWQFVNPGSPVMLTGNHPALSTEPDRCYASLLMVGDRLHMMGMFARIDEGTSLWWRRGGHYIWSDPPYSTWKSIDGTTMTLPLTFNNYTAAAITSAPAMHESWGQSWCMDSNGYPHMVLENTQANGQPGNPTYYECYWTGSAWTSRAVFAPGSSSGPGIFNLNGTLLTITSAFGRMRAGDVISHNAIYPGQAAPNGICPVPDPIGVRDGNRISFVCSDGDNPLVFDVGVRLKLPG